MSILNDAQTLRRAGPPIYDSICLVCHAVVEPFPPETPQPHAPTCASLALPKIVAALEAAERVAMLANPTSGDLCPACRSFRPYEDHANGCALQALVTALSGEEAMAVPGGAGMSILGDARRLAEENARGWWAGPDRWVCACWWPDIGEGHKPHCPTPHLPKIVAVLEASERVSQRYGSVYIEDLALDIEALVAALAGEGVTA